MAKKKSKKKSKQRRARVHEIVVAVDGSGPSDAAVRWAASLCCGRFR